MIICIATPGPDFVHSLLGQYSLNLVHISGVFIFVVLFKVALSLLEAEGYKDLKIST